MSTPLPNPLVPSTDVDVLVVGLGPVGAALANLLGRYGVRVLAIDKASTVFDKPRAIALDNEALRILQQVGVRDGEFATVAIPQVQYRSPLFGRFARINSAGIVDGHPALVTFHQPELERLLRAKLAQHPHVEMQTGVEMTSFVDDGLHVHALLKRACGEPMPVRARYLVGTDGSGSLVRRRLGLEFKGRSFEQSWLIVDAVDVPDPIDHVEFVCDPRRPSPRMVAPGGRQRWEFMLAPGEHPEEMERPDTVKRLLAPWCKGEDIRIERTAVYRFHARSARRFSRGRCFLAGDAAHLTPPFAGQGLVAGLRDVSNLAWKLAWVLRGQADEKILDSYDAERRTHAKQIIRLARLLGLLVMPRNRAAAFVIHGAVSLLRLLPGGRALFEDLKIKPSNTFAHGLFRRERRHEHLRAGAMLPQGWVRRVQGGAPMLSDDVLGPHWALVGFGVDPASQLPPSVLRDWQAAGGRVWQWCPRSQGQHLAPGAQRFEALDEALLPRRVPNGWVAIVRPDRCVFSEGPAPQAQALVTQALATLAPAAARMSLTPVVLAQQPLKGTRHAA